MNKYNSETTDDKRYRLMMEKRSRAFTDAGPVANAPPIDTSEGEQRRKDFDESRIQTKDERDLEKAPIKAQALNKGGMLKDPDREGYVTGTIVKGVTRAAKKLIGKDTPTTKPRRPHRTKEQIQEDGERKDYSKGLTTDFVLGAPDSDKLRKLKLSQIPEGTPEFKKAFKKAWKAKKDVFMYQDKEYKVEDLIQEGNQMYKSSFNKGGMMKYAEGSMLVPPEMGMEEDMPEDTYNNIPEDEMAAVEASQLPDAEMEEDYTGYVLEQSLDTEEQQYLMSVLETDERLGGIFDKVMDVAGEFAGNGVVEGLGDGTSDSIPARLSDGEFVFTKKATDQMGADQLQTMMDDAERAYDGGLMKKAFGGLTREDDVGMESYDSEEEVKKQMISANQMPSIR